MYKLRAELRAHSADVRGVAVSSTGLIATCSRDNTIILWDVDAIEPTNVLRGHSHFVNSLVFLDANRLVSAAADNTLRVWDVKTGQCLKTLQGHQASVCGVARVNDSQVISASWDATARLWDVEMGVCIRVLTGHEAAVWDVAVLPDGKMVSVGADKTVRLWEQDGVKVLPAVHTDVVRGVHTGPKGGFITVANDSTLVHWMDMGNGFTPGLKITDLHDGSYVYSVDAAETEPRKWLSVSGGEDNAVRITEVDFTTTPRMNCIQTVMHPGTVWSACLCPGGEFVSACSDGVARVFTKDPNLVADPGVLSSFEKAVSERQVNTKVIGGVDVTKLPEAEAALAEPGKKDGENKIVKTAGGKAEVYMWSAADSKWTKVGEVVDNPSGGSGGGMIKGKMYDYVFEVEIGEGGKKEKLGFNRGENPYLAAQRFIDDNELGQDFLDQIAQFIEQQVPKDALQPRQGGPSDPLTGGSRYVPGGGSGASNSGGDPLTGGSRYVPGMRSSGQVGGSDPLTGGSRYVPGGGAMPNDNLPPPRKLIPYKDGFVLYKNKDQVPKMQSKLGELNSALASSNPALILNAEEAKVFGHSLMVKLQDRSGAPVILSDEDCAVVAKLMKWPTSSVLAVLDVARLVVAVPTGSSTLFGKMNGAVLDDVLGHMSDESASGAVHMMGCRFLCNAFASRVGGSKIKLEVDQVLKATENASKHSNRRTRETCAALMINLAVSMYESGGEKDGVIKNIVEHLTGQERDEEVAYRLMLALGTIMCIGKETAMRAVELGAADAAASVAGLSARTQQVALEIATLVAT